MQSSVKAPSNHTPSYCAELEKLNHATDAINRLELELDEARGAFRQMLTESAVRLNGLSKKLGGCIEKARPYYEARMHCKFANSILCLRKPVVPGQFVTTLSPGHPRNSVLFSYTYVFYQAKKPRRRRKKLRYDLKELTVCTSPPRRW